MFGLGMGELVLIFLVILFLFGGKKLPEIGKGLGKAIGEFKKGISDSTASTTEETDEKKQIENNKKQS